MPTMIAYHDIVKDTEHWLSSPKREEFFGPLGVSNIRTSSTRRTRGASVSSWTSRTSMRSWPKWTAPRPPRRWRTTASCRSRS